MTPLSRSDYFPPYGTVPTCLCASAVVALAEIVSFELRNLSSCDQLR